MHMIFKSLGGWVILDDVTHWPIYFLHCHRPSFLTDVRSWFTVALSPTLPLPNSWWRILHTVDHSDTLRQIKTQVKEKNFLLLGDIPQTLVPLGSSELSGPNKSEHNSEWIPTMAGCLNYMTSETPSKFPLILWLQKHKLTVTMVFLSHCCYKKRLKNYVM